VVVTASGGGIHAAGWTTQVLTGLQELLGSEFTKSIGLISGVSGGSIGTMYFLDKCGDNGYPEQENLPIIVQNAVQDGLDAIGWRLVYRDLWRFIGLPLVLLLNKYEDRGTALEKNWQGYMDQPNMTLSYWREKALAGEIPIPVFNATLIEDGRRLLVSPMTFATKHKNDRTIDFNTLYQKDDQRYDIKVVTAARLSATFPYVSPSPRNPDIKIERNYHIADGGYFDNSGVVTAIEWLEDNFDDITDKNKLHIQKLVFIEIEAQETPELTEKVNSGGWYITIFGAIQALFSVRSASLLLRNQQEIDLLLKHYRSKLDDINPISNVQYLRIDFPRRSKSRFKIVKNKKVWEKVGEEYSQPLSWKLTASQKYVLQEAWQDLLNEDSTDESICSIKKLADIWGNWRSLKQ
jgi:Patatin-like phospholipase